MSIEIHDIDGVLAPVIVCDVCGHRIEKASDGNAAWYMPLYGGKNRGQLLFVHRAEPFGCDWKLNRPGREVLPCWDNLDVFLVNLVRNVSMDRQDAEARAALLAEIGL